MRLTGIDPFNVYAARLLEHEKPEYNAAVYQYVLKKGWLVEPMVFVSHEGKTWSELEDFDAEVFFPPQLLVGGRPDWYVRDLGRTAVPRRAFLEARNQRFIEISNVQAVCHRSLL